MKFGRWLRWTAGLLVGLLLVLPLLLGAVFYGLLATEPGSGWLLQHVREQVNARDGGLSLAWDGVEGRLLDELRLSGLRIEGPGLAINAATVGLRWRARALLDRHLHLRSLSISGLEYRGISTAQASSEPPTALELPELELPLRVTLDQLAIDGASIRHDDLEYQAGSLRLALAHDGERLRVSGLELVSEPLELQGALALGVRAPYTLSLDLRGSGMVPELGRVRASLGASGPALNAGIEARISAPVALDVTGRVDLRAPQPSLDLTANWEELNWPPRGQPVYRSLDGRLALAGQAGDYRLTLSSRVRGQDLPELELELDARGDRAGLDLQPFSARLLDGRVTATGRVDWMPGIAWNLALGAQGLNPGRYPLPQAAEFAGRLSARIASAGRVGKEGPSLAIDIVELDGQLREQPLRVRGRLELEQGAKGPRLRARKLDLASGQNRLRVDGLLGESVNLSFDIQAADLAELRLPAGYRLAGAMNGTGRLGGSRWQPTVQAQLNGRGLAFREHRLEQVDVDADWSEGGGRILLSGLDADLAGTRFGRIGLELAGSPESHRLELDARAEAWQVQLGVDGGLDPHALEGGAAQDPPPRWQGEVQRLQLAATPLGDWGMASPAALTMMPGQAELGRLCLQPQGASAAVDGRLCAGGGWRADGSIALEGQIERLALGLFAPLMPEDLRIDGLLDGHLRLSGRAQDPLAELELTSNEGLLSLAGADEPIEVAYRNAGVQARYAHAGSDARLRLELGDNGRAGGEITLGPAPARTLGGTLKASFPDLSLIAGLVPALESTHGRFELAADLSGSLDQPRFVGELLVSGARMRVPEAGIEIDDIRLSARGDGSGPLQVEGGARSGMGRLALSGSVDPGQPGMPLDVNIEGRDFQVARLPEARISLSPKLRIQGAAPYRVTGRLLLPEAQIELKEIPATATRVSADEVIVGREERVPKAAVPAVEADVRVDLGERVHLKGFGLNTRLSGGVRARSHARGAELNGKINLVDATYKAYGQDLKVEQGRLLFSGPPRNPELDLRALRVSRDGRVKAYLAMSGPASRPRPRIYSEPALPDAEALAYLLTGRGLDQAGKGEGLDIASAALSYGMAQGEPLLQGMAERLGLEDLQIQGGEKGLEDTSLLVGTYLRPDLYLGYSQGLFDATAALLLRLQLSDRIEVESRAGTSQSVDLFYRLEHD